MTDFLIAATAVRYNNDQTITYGGAEFYAEQRNAGFADNDGSWVITLHAQNVWTTGGVLCEARPGRHVGVFTTIAAADRAIRDTVIPDAHRHPRMIR